VGLYLARTGTAGQTRGGSGLPLYGRGAPVEEVSPQDRLLPEGLHVIAYRATLDVPRELVLFVARLLRAEPAAVARLPGAGR
jgi:hypothetical protein